MDCLAVTKTRRSSDGTEVHSQTFVNVFAPTDAHGQCLPADSKSLPIISRVSQVTLGDCEFQWTPRTSLRLSTCSESAIVPGGQCSFSTWLYQLALWVEHPEELVREGVTHHSDGTGRCRGWGASHGWTDRFCHRRPGPNDRVAASRTCATR